VIGWIKLHRELLGKSIWLNSTVEQKAVLITIMLLASHKNNSWEWSGTCFTVKPGEFITSSTKLADVAGVSRQNVRTSLKRFEKLEFLTTESTSKGMLITVTNWELYQGNPDEANQQSNQNLTASQPTPNHYQELKNIKNAKKEKDICVSFDQFWQLYPKKKAKTKAEVAFKKLNPDDVLLSAMFTALQAQLSCNDWLKDNGQFIPYPATWINQRRWEDVPEVQNKSHTPETRRGFYV
jgi:DNA-binding transcriptional regulator YhcF (GntR family)